MAVAAWLLGSAHGANAIVLRFDEVAAGTAVDSQYAILGITFDNPVGGSIYANGLDWTLSDSQSNVVSVFQSTSPAFDARWGAVEAVFATGQRRVAVDARILRLPEGLGTPINYPKLEIYDTGGNFITSVPWNFSVIPQPGVGGITPYQTLSYSSSTNNIGKVRILSGQPGGSPSNFGIFDDLRVGGASCAHDLCTTGALLAPTCDACAAAVCVADSYCCQTAWDSICVGEVSTVCSSNQCSAGSIVVDAVDGGYLSASPSASTGVAFSGPAFASWDSGTAPRARQYHKFDLTSVTPWIASARLLLEYPQGATRNVGGTLMLQEVTSSPNTFGFDFAGGVMRPWSSSVYQDLADGANFGSRLYGTGDEGKVTSIDLDAAAVAAINAARGGIFSIGGYHAGYTGPIVPAYSTLFDNSGDGDTGDDPRNGLPTLRRLVLTPAVGIDSDGDLIPDAYDSDDDNDGVLDVADNCRVRPNPTQCNFDADAYGNSCDPDFDQSNTVNVADLNQFRGAYLAGSTNGDMNCSGGAPNVADLNSFRGLYLGSSPGRLDSCLNVTPANDVYCP